MDSIQSLLKCAKKAHCFRKLSQSPVTQRAQWRPCLKRDLPPPLGFRWACSALATSRLAGTLHHAIVLLRSIYPKHVRSGECSELASVRSGPSGLVFGLEVGGMSCPKGFRVGQGWDWIADDQIATVLHRLHGSVRLFDNWLNDEQAGCRLRLVVADELSDIEVMLTNKAMRHVLDAAVQVLETSTRSDTTSTRPAVGRLATGLPALVLVLPVNRPISPN